ncbi:MAG TPA: hypothetical protein VF339_02875 [Gammaproteobacteria bacterium]
MNFSNRLYAIGAARNPAVQVLSLLAFGVVLIGAVVMGAVILTFVFALAVIAAAAFSVRLWWLKRKLGRRHSEAMQAATGGRLIEAEYTVVTERSTRRTP